MGGILFQVPIPADDPIAQPRRPETPKGQKDSQEGKITRPWTDYFTSLGGQVQQATRAVDTVSLPTQTATIGPTDISDGNLAGGVYSFGYFLAITNAGGAGGTVSVTLDWTYDGTARSWTGAVLNSDVAAEWDSENKLIRIDSGSPVRYSTTVVAGAPLAEYSIDVVLSQVQA